MARKVKLINYHSSTATTTPAADIEYGEISVLHKDEATAKLQIKVANDKVASFISEAAIKTIEKNLQGQIDSITGESGSLNDYLKKEDAANTYETKTDASTKKTEAISSAKTYTDDEIAKLTGTTDGSLQSQITANKTSISDHDKAIKELSAGTTAYTNTIVSNAKTELIGTIADTKDIKTIEGTRKYAESLATEITGSTTGSIGARLKAVEDKATANASNISKNAEKITALEGIDADTSASKSIVGAKKYADEKIAKAVSSVYKVKGTCTYAELPESGNANGDVWNVTDAQGNVPAGTNYVWLASEDGGSWDALAGTVDLSPYFKTVDFNKTLTADTSFTSVKNTAEAAATKNELADVKKTADAAAVKTDVDTALESKVAKTDLGTYATKKGIQDALDLKANQSDLETLESKVDGITGTTLSGYVKVGNTTDVATDITGYGLQKYADNAATTESNKVKTALEGNSVSTSATTTIEGAKKFATQSVAELKKEVDKNTTGVSDNKTEIGNLKKSVDTAVQTITVTNTEINKITATKTGTNYTFNFDNMVIDCGEF